MPGVTPVSVILANLKAVDLEREDLSDVRTKAKRTALALNYNEAQTREVILAADAVYQKQLRAGSEQNTATIQTRGNVIAVSGSLVVQDLQVTGRTQFTQAPQIAGNVITTGGGGGGSPVANISYLQFDSSTQGLNVSAATTSLVDVSANTIVLNGNSSLLTPVFTAPSGHANVNMLIATNLYVPPAQGTFAQITPDYVQLPGIFCNGPGNNIQVTAGVTMAGGLQVNDLRTTGNLTTGNFTAGSDGSSPMSYTQTSDGTTVQLPGISIVQTTDQSFVPPQSKSDITVTGTLSCTGADNACSALVVGPMVVTDPYGGSSGSINMTNYGDMSCVGSVTLGGLNLKPGYGYADGSVDLTQATVVRAPGGANFTPSGLTIPNVTFEGSVTATENSNVDFSQIQYFRTRGGAEFNPFGSFFTSGLTVSGGLVIGDNYGQTTASADFTAGPVSMQGGVRVDGNGLHQPRGLYGVQNNTVVPPNSTQRLGMNEGVGSPVISFDQSNSNLFTVNADGMYTLAFDHIRTNRYDLFANMPWNIVHTNYEYGPDFTVTSPLQYGTNGLSRYFHAGDSFYVQVLNQTSDSCEIYGGVAGTNLLITYILA